jgi:hypothetical protein
LDEPGDDQFPLPVGEAAESRGDRERGEARDEDLLRAYEVAYPPSKEQEATKRNEIRVDYPGKGGLGEVELALDGGERDVHHCGVEHDHELPYAKDHKSDPAAPLGLLPGGAARFSVRQSHRHDWQTPETGFYSSSTLFSFMPDLGGFAGSVPTGGRNVVVVVKFL